MVVDWFVRFSAFGRPVQRMRPPSPSLAVWLACGCWLGAVALAQDLMLLDEAKTVPATSSNIQLADGTDLQAQDGDRYTLVAGQSSGNIVYDLGEPIDTVVVVLYLDEDNDETVSFSAQGVARSMLLLETEDAARAARGTRNGECSRQGSNLEICRISSQYIKATWTVQIEACVNSVTLILDSGAGLNNRVSVGRVEFLGPRADCGSSNSSASTGLIAGVCVGAVGLLLASCICWRCFRKRAHDAPDLVNSWHADVSDKQAEEAQGDLPMDRMQMTEPPPPPTPVNRRASPGLPSLELPVSHQPPQDFLASQALAPLKVESRKVSEAGLPPLKPVRASSKVASKESVAIDVCLSEDEEAANQGPTADEEPESMDPDQQLMLQDIHMKQAAGITDMLQGVKDHLMQQQTLHRDEPQESHLEIFQKVGGGGFGEVFKGRFRGKEVAVKIMKIKPGANQEALTELPYTEAAIAGVCIHPNIVQTMYADLKPVFALEQGRSGLAQPATTDQIAEWQVRMVMEMCNHGSVRDWVSHAAGQKHGPLYSAVPAKAGTKGCGRTLCALLTALDVANGMKLLHKYKILHGDLKPHNVLISSSHTDLRGFTAKLSDFGLSMKMAVHDGEVPGIKYGTVQYLAPEVLKTHVMTTKADVYSFGIIMWEVWHSRLFAEFYNVEKKRRRATGRTMDDYRPLVSSKCPKPFVKLMTKCLEQDPEARPDFLGGKVNLVVELERLIFDEYQRAAAFDRLKGSGSHLQL